MQDINFLEKKGDVMGLDYSLTVAPPTAADRVLHVSYSMYIVTVLAVHARSFRVSDLEITCAVYIII